MRALGGEAMHAFRALPSDARDRGRLERQLPPLLSVIAGMVDVIGFLSLGLFTAHVTGNLVVIAALLVRGGHPNMTQVLAVPVFMIAVAVVWYIARARSGHGTSLARPLLVVQFLFLTCALLSSVIGERTASRHEWMATVTVVAAVSAMACQFVLLRVAMAGSPSTAVMTGNLTNAVLAILDTLSNPQTLTGSANERMTMTLMLLAGFFVGCMAGAAAVSWLADWAWLLPAVLAAAAVSVPSAAPHDR